MNKFVWSLLFLVTISRPATLKEMYNQIEKQQFDTVFSYIEDKRNKVTFEDCASLLKNIKYAYVQENALLDDNQINRYMTILNNLPEQKRKGLELILPTRAPVVQSTLVPPSFTAVAALGTAIGALVGSFAAVGALSSDSEKVCIKSLEDNIQNLQAETNRLGKVVTDLQGANVQLEKEKGGLNAQLTKQQSALAAAQKELQDRLAEQKQQLDALQPLVVQAQSGTDDQRKKVEYEAQELIKQLSQKDIDIQKISGRVAQLQKQFDQVLAILEQKDDQIIANTATIADAQRAIAEKNDAYKKMQADYERATMRVNELESIVYKMRADQKEAQENQKKLSEKTAVDKDVLFGQIKNMQGTVNTLMGRYGEFITELNKLVIDQEDDMNDCYSTQDEASIEYGDQLAIAAGKNKATIQILQAQKAKLQILSGLLNVLSKASVLDETVVKNVSDQVAEIEKTNEEVLKERARIVFPASPVDALKKKREGQISDLNKRVSNLTDQFNSVLAKEKELSDTVLKEFNFDVQTDLQEDFLQKWKQLYIKFDALKEDISHIEWGILNQKNRMDRARKKVDELSKKKDMTDAEQKAYDALCEKVLKLRRKGEKSEQDERELKEFLQERNKLEEGKRSRDEQRELENMQRQLTGNENAFDGLLNAIAKKRVEINEAKKQVDDMRNKYIAFYADMKMCDEDKETITCEKDTAKGAIDRFNKELKGPVLVEISQELIDEVDQLIGQLASFTSLQKFWAAMKRRVLLREDLAVDRAGKKFFSGADKLLSDMLVFKLELVALSDVLKRIKNDQKRISGLTGDQLQKQLFATLENFKQYCSFQDYAIGQRSSLACKVLVAWKYRMKHFISALYRQEAQAIIDDLESKLAADRAANEKKVQEVLSEIEKIKKEQNYDLSGLREQWQKEQRQQDSKEWIRQLTNLLQYMKQKPKSKSIYTTTIDVQSFLTENRDAVLPFLENMRFNKDLQLDQQLSTFLAELQG